jgi:hypothetical protein
MCFVGGRGAQPEPKVLFGASVQTTKPAALTPQLSKHNFQTNVSSRTAYKNLFLLVSVSHPIIHVLTLCFRHFVHSFLEFLFIYLA